MQSKRLACLALAGTLLVGAFAAVLKLPAAAEDADSMWLVREYENDVYSVSCEDKTVTDVEIPSVIDGKTITMVEVDAFKDCEQLQHVTIPDTVTVIEDYSFYNCPALQEITIPRSVENIGFQAFYGCAMLETVNIPASVTDLEAFAFEGCGNLKTVTVAEDNPSYMDVNGVLFDKDGKTLILYPSAMEGDTYTVPEGCTEVYDYAFIGNPYLKTVDISGITTLGEDAFYFCTSLQSMDIPDAVTELEGSVFGNCSALERVKLPANLVTIGDSCFYNCLKLSDIEIPETVQTISNYAFFNCPSLTRIHLTKTTETIGNYALGWYFSGDSDEPKRLPDFEVDAEDNTAAFDYCVNNSIKCTGGVTQGTVFLYIIIGVVALVVIVTIIIIVVQKRIQKRYELP